MEIVRPIKDKKQIEKMKQILKQSNIRNYIMFIVGIYSALRISDILQLKVEDVRDKTHITIKEQKTHKNQHIKIHSVLKIELDEYVKNMRDDEYLIQSGKGYNQPLSRIQAWAIIKTAAKQAGIKDDIGTHSLRKTYGFHHYQQFKDVATLQNILNHSSPAITLRYIGITQECMDDMMDSFSY